MHYYCLGIKGAGMSALAAILHDLGNAVTGYDDHAERKYTQEGLDARGIAIYNGPELPLTPDMVVTHSRALRDDHPEIVRARAAGLQFVGYDQLMGSLTAQFHTVGVAGTHGKTTTTSLITLIIDSVLGCNYFIGDGTGHAAPGNQLFVMEADEFNRHFLSYHPELAIVTNVELDHVEHYPTLDSVAAAFLEFGNRAQLVVACGDDPNTRAISFGVPVLYYGTGEGNDVVARDVVMDGDGSRFNCFIDGQLFGAFEFPVPGHHMLLNALAAIAACRHYGVSAADIALFMSLYETAKRRFKAKEFGGVVSIDDYAHHPTELRVTLETARLKYPDKPVVAVFLPNTYSRTGALMGDFVEVLSTADKAYVMDIDCDRERPQDYPGVTSDTLIAQVPGAEKIDLGTVDKLLCHGDAAVCFMSCADIAPIREAFEARLSAI